MKTAEKIKANLIDMKDVMVVQYVKYSRSREKTSAGVLPVTPGVFYRFSTF